MPFKSEKQRRYMWANHPEIAERWTKLEKSGKHKKKAKKTKKKKSYGKKKR